MRNIKLAILALVAIMALGAVAAAGASASHPEFKTESGKTLLFTATGGAATLVGERLGIEGTIKCEKSATHGEILNATPLADKILISFTGKCGETVGSTKTECTEPITVKESTGELGLVAGKEVGLYLAPNGTTIFAEPVCGGEKTTVGGAIIGLFPETSKYNKLEKEALLTFKAKGSQQEPTTIELLGASMTGVELKTEGFLGGKASEATEATIKPDGKVEIKT